MSFGTGFRRQWMNSWGETSDEPRCWTNPSSPPTPNLLDSLLDLFLCMFWDFFFSVMFLLQFRTVCSTSVVCIRTQ